MGDGEGGEGAGGVGEEDGGFGRGELGDGLAAGSAGLAGAVFEIDDEDGAEADAGAVGGDGAGDGGLFGAGSEAEGGVFDVATGDDAGFGDGGVGREKEGGADVKVGVGGVGAGGGGAGVPLELGDQFGGEFGEEIGRGHAGERLPGGFGRCKRDRELLEEAALLADHAIDQALGEGHGESPVFKALRDNGVAELRRPCGEGLEDDLAYAFGGQSALAFGEEVLKEAAEDGAVLGRIVLGDVGLLGLVKDGRDDGAGADDDDVDAIKEELAAEAFGHAFEGELGGDVGAEEGCAEPAADGADLDDAPGMARARAVCAEQRAEGLGDEEGAEEVDFEGLAKLGGGLVQKGAAAGDTGIVDQAEEGAVAELGGDDGGGGPNAGLVGDVHQNGRDGVAEFTGEPVCVGLLANAGEDVDAVAAEDFGDAVADAGGGSGDDDAS